MPFCGAMYVVFPINIFGRGVYEGLLTAVFFVYYTQTSILYGFLPIRLSLTLNSFPNLLLNIFLSRHAEAPHVDLLRDSGYSSPVYPG